MPRRYRLTPAAQRDLDDIFDYSASQFGLAQAERYTAELQAACEQLADQPTRAQDSSAIRAGYRRWPVGRHMIWLRVETDGITVIRILHQRMDVAARLP